VHNLQELNFRKESQINSLKKLIKLLKNNKLKNNLFHRFTKNFKGNLVLILSGNDKKAGKNKLGQMVVNLIYVEP
jgi:hypothetical protein